MAQRSMPLRTNDFESDNITDELRRQGVVSAPKLITRKDGGGQLGGKLIQDKLWFFADLRYRKVIREIPFATRPGWLDHPQTAASVLPGVQGFGADQSDEQAHRVLASVRRSRKAVSQPVRAGTCDGTEQCLGRDVEARMAGDHRAVPHLVGAARAIRTREPVPRVRPWECRGVSTSPR